MSTERKNPQKRGQALNDATSGQLGDEPRPGPSPGRPSKISDSNSRPSRVRAARKMSRHI
ncbi:MAG TPA: hypothetical protein VFR94_19235 [Nitrososphaeraceae archaeon]|nr:hypothetical protein [Nitrososphaeraceae archaeon]